MADLMALADQPATVRQIVTRLLKRFERAGWVAIGCERVQILNAPALRSLTSGQAADNALAGQQSQQHPSG